MAGWLAGYSTESGSFYSPWPPYEWLAGWLAGWQKIVLLHKDL
jgi:hypothetical protein